MTKNFKASFKKFLTIVCAMTLVFSAFAVSASDDKTIDDKTIIDESDILTPQTEQYIEENLKEARHVFAGITRFSAEPISKMPYFNENHTISGEYFFDVNLTADLNETIIIWADGANEIKSFNLFNTNGDTKNYRDVQRLIKKHVKNIDDRQTVIRDSFSLFVACRYYYYDNVENIPDTLTVSGISDISAFVKKELDRYTFIRNTFGTVFGVAVIAAIVVFFARRKTPEGTVPGDGSNFKDGIGSGVAAMTGMPGTHGYTTGMGNLGAGPRG